MPAEQFKNAENITLFRRYLIVQVQGFKVFTLKTLHFENGRALSVFKIQAAINAQTR